MRYALMVATALLAGCASQIAQQRSQEFHAAADECKKSTEGMTHAARARCVADAANRIFPPSPGIALLNTTRISLATKIDRGEMTEEDAAAEYARVAFQVQQEEQRTRAQQAAAAAAIMSSGPTTCTTYGHVTNCY